MCIVSIALLFLIIKNSKDESVSVAVNSDSTEDDSGTDTSRVSDSLDDDPGTSGVSEVLLFSLYLTFGCGGIRVICSKGLCVSLALL